MKGKAGGAEMQFTSCPENLEETLRPLPGCRQEERVASRCSMQCTRALSRPPPSLSPLPPKENEQSWLRGEKVHVDEHATSATGHLICHSPAQDPLILNRPLPSHETQDQWTD